MGWECPACTFLNQHETYLQCECCGSERPSAEARPHPAPGQRRRRQQQAPADPHITIVEIDLLSSEDEDDAEEQQQQQPQPQPQQQQQQQQQPQAQQPDQQQEQQEQRSLGSMGAGGSKSSGGVAVARSPLGTSPPGWGEDTWDDDFQVQLSESLATTIRQLQQPGTASVHKQARWAEAEAAAEAAAAAAEAEVAAKAAAAEAGKQQHAQEQQEQQVAAGGDARVDIDLTGEEWQEPLVQQPKSKKARRAKEAAAATGGQQQQQRQQQQAKQQPGSRQPAEQGSGSSAHTALLDAEAGAAAAAAAAAGAAATAAATAPPSKKPRLAAAVQAGAADAADEGQTAGWAMRALRVAARYASRQATSGKQQAAAEEPTLRRQQQQQQQQPSDSPGRQELALQSCRRASKRPWSATLQLPGAPLRRLPSMHLGSPDSQQAQAGPLPVNPSLRLPPRRQSPGGTSPGSGSLGMSPPLGSSPESVQRLPDAVAAVGTVQRHEQQEGEQQQQQQQQQQQGGSGGRVAWQQCVAALYDPAPLPAQQAQQAVQQMPLPPAAPIPAWVQRARQGPDVTEALVAAAADCPHVPLPTTWRQQRQQEREPAPVPGWLAYRVAGVLPESAGCQHAADVLRVGTAAAAAAAAVDAEAGSGAERQQEGAQPAGTGPQQQQQLDLSQLAARLVAGLTMQEEPYSDLEEHSMHLFSHRNSALHRKLKRHLAPLLGGSAAGGSRRPRIPCGRPPSRLRLPGAGDAAGDGGEGAAAAAGAASEAGAAAAAAAAAAQPFTGVRTTAEGRFTACLYVRSEQLWLGSYAEVEAAARAVDLAMVYRWLCHGRPADRPAFNLPHNRYLEDGDLLQELERMPGTDALKSHIKRACGAAPPNWWQR